MAHTLSGRKRIRQNAKINLRNRVRKERLRKTVKTLNESLKAAKPEEVATALKAAHKSLDKAKTKGFMHRKTVDRRKSRLAKAANKALAAAKPA